MNRLGRFSFWEFDQAWYTPKYYKVTGVFFLFLYVFFQVLWGAAGDIGETASAVLGLIAFFIFGKGLRNSGAIWLLLAAVAVQGVSWILMHQYRPEWVPDNPQFDRLAKLFIFIAVAWWLGGSTRNTLVVWLMASIGFIAATFIYGQGVDNWVDGILHGKRTGFGIRNDQHASMFYGVCALGFIAFSKRFICRPTLVIWRLLVWVFLVGLIFLALLIGQTRAIWIATTLSLLVMLVLWATWYIRQGDIGKVFRNILAGFFLIAFILGSVGWLFGDTLIKRGLTEQSVVTELAQGDISHVPYSSIGIRIHSWVAASEWIAQRPFTGWGPWGRGLVIDHTSWLPDLVKDNFGHLHNFFIEIWVAYGVMGLLLIAALAVWIGRAAWRAWRGGALPNDMALFSICFFVYWMIVNQIESYMSFWTGVYVFNLVVGGLITHYWRWKLQIKADPESRDNPNAFSEEYKIKSAAL
ncbi:O-antigen ligase family protein [Kushneria phyllosphaerae]|uniref:O-antigen ligase-related domain-containing protein n=1 Tax=Kushneria phyllosphaerae TaxID=2100822 RepID=A0A2R8CNC1_9GAMM|nr:O-antigen ligase family protein [Kushneria phyllosphaerae]SPJ34397.1 hypothetical protein KSP9073_02431 [Kushneria phyllosphaerae]